MSFYDLHIHWHNSLCGNKFQFKNLSSTYTILHTSRSTEWCWSTQAVVTKLVLGFFIFWTGDQTQGLKRCATELKPQPLVLGFLIEHTALRVF